MFPKLGGPALSLPPLLLLLLLGASGGSGGARAEVLFRCPPCTPERLAACGPPPVAPSASVAGTTPVPCAELVREPGCGCCSVCARLEGEACGVYTPRCGQGLRCYPRPGSELPLQALVMGAGTCQKLRDAENGASPEQVGGNVGWDKELGETWRVAGSPAGGRDAGEKRAAGPHRLLQGRQSRDLAPDLWGLWRAGLESQARGGELE
ncbi:Insulin-like growth factor-binding protein 2 [Saguinus oedipus]|uniref:Insulin-like growth factor-binding protein 2 n=1 Tax=Saguinus oedipus TaxID=9490 RepID=A0ABQ9VGK2_SAGOE|nr:Insulin-like growth factor-binding protein 2 [Saguinus oedipus]